MVFTKPESAPVTSLSDVASDLLVRFKLITTKNINTTDNNKISASVMYGNSEGGMAESDRPNNNLGAATNCGIATIAANAVTPDTLANQISLF